MKILRILNRLFLVVILFFVSACNPRCTPAYDAQIVVESQEIPAPSEGRTAILIPLEIKTQPKDIGIVVQAFLWLGGEDFTPVGSSRGQGELKENLVIVDPNAHRKLENEGIAWIRIDVKFVYKKGDTSIPTLMNITWNELDTEPVSWFVKILRPPKIADLQFPAHEGGAISFYADHRSDRLLVATEFPCDQSNLDYCRELKWKIYDEEDEVGSLGSNITIPTNFEEGQSGRPSRGHLRLCVVDGAKQTAIVEKYVEYRDKRLVEISQPEKGWWGPLDHVGKDKATNFYSQSWMPENESAPIEKVENAKMTNLELEGWDFINVGLLFVEALIPGGRVPP